MIDDKCRAIQESSEMETALLFAALTSSKDAERLAVKIHNLSALNKDKTAKALQHRIKILNE